MSALTVGSLFSGIGGLELGLERAGMRVVWQVEKDEYCRRVLAKHWPDVARYDDVCTVGAHNLEPVDLICGGFPCQDISFAGKGAGIRGKRSGLWSEFARIVRELRPRHVLVENVPALLARGLGVVLGELAESGYDAEWDCIPASSLGAPHQRDRLFILAHTGCDGVQSFGVAGFVDGAQRGNREADGARDDIPTAACGGSADVADAQRNGLEESRHIGISPGWRATDSVADDGWWAVEPDVGRVAHGIPARVDRLRSLGNAVVPQVAEYVGRLIVAAVCPDDSEPCQRSA